jgi:hypothetical protein
MLHNHKNNQIKKNNLEFLFTTAKFSNMFFWRTSNLEYSRHTGSKGNCTVFISNRNFQGAIY